MNGLTKLSHVLGVLVGVLFLLAALSLDSEAATGKVSITILKHGEESFSKCIVRLTKKYRPRTSFQAIQISSICRKEMKEVDFRRD